MTVYEYRRGVKLPTDGCAVAIGFFDGVHLAHRELIREAVADARARGALAGVVTFASDSGVKPSALRIFSDEDRLSLFESLGADFAVVCRFSEIADMSGADFVTEALAGDIGALAVVAGYNFRFGKGASSDARDLEQYMAASGGRAIIKDACLYRGEPLSSSLIRTLLAEGDVGSAAEALGQPYFVSGSVSHGRGVGRGLGFPTVNLPEAPGRVKLKRGVYRCAVLVEGALYNAVTNVGVCPTYGGVDSHIEAHLLDFSGDLYGREVRIYFLGFLREERRFDSPEELKMQIKVDKNRTIEENGESLWQEIGRS